MKVISPNISVKPCYIVIVLFTYQVASRWTLHGATNLQVSSGFKLLNSWGVPNAGSVFPAFFTPELVSRLLHSCDQGQGHVIAANVPLLLREGRLDLCGI